MKTSDWINFRTFNIKLVSKEVESETSFGKYKWIKLSCKRRE
ncbi:MAG: hypothetical protein ACTS44_01625 [Candidatus Hodgkinia cicadicola]